MRPCQYCGHQPILQHAIRCASCGRWDAFDLEVPNFYDSPPQQLSTIGKPKVTRLKTGIPTFDWLLGGGGIPVSEVVMIRGRAGTGKTTLALSIASAIQPSLYISREQAFHELKSASKRLGLNIDHVAVSNEANVTPHNYEGYRITVADSVQLLTYGREAISYHTNAMAVQYLKETFATLDGSAAILLSQVNGAGEFAGMESVPHVVGVHIGVEIDSESRLRYTTYKNRHGPIGRSCTARLTRKGVASWQKA